MNSDKCNNNINIPEEDMIIEISDTLIQDELCVCHIAEKVNMSQSAVSHQLRILKASRLVKPRKEGKTVYYSLDDDHVEKILNVVLEHVKEEEV